MSNQPQFIQTFQNLQNQINQMTTTFANYTKNCKMETYKKQTNNYEQEKNKAENILDRQMQTFNHGSLIIKNCSQLADTMKEMTKQFETFYEDVKNVIKSVQTESDKLLNELINMASVELQKVTAEIAEFSKNGQKTQFNQNRQNFSDFPNFPNAEIGDPSKIFQNGLKSPNNPKNLAEKKIDLQKEIEQYEQMKIGIEIKRQGGLSEQLMRNIENITDNKKMKSIIFDSQIQRWGKNDKDFNNTIHGKKDLLIMAKTEKNNWVGGYVIEKIDKEDEYAPDGNCFIFETEKDNVSKYEIKKDNVKYATCCFSAASDCLFCFGYKGLFISRKDKMTLFDKSSESSFGNKVDNGNVNRRVGYGGMVQNVQKDDTMIFTPKRVLVIQMY